MQTTRIRIETIDRPYMTYDITSLFVKYSVNIIWMEVYTFVVYIKFTLVSQETLQNIKEELLDISGVKSVEEINLIAFEEREIEIRSILDGMTQGVILLGKDEKVRYINKYAQNYIFNIDSTSTLNTKFVDLLPDHKRMEFQKLLAKPGKIENMELVLKNQNYFLNTSPITSESNILCGYTITIQNTKKINDIINSKRYNNPITLEDIIGTSSHIYQSKEMAKIYAKSESPVLITGESGTGKEIFARAIHNLSNRLLKPFIPINCGAIPDQLLESELFGYEGGTFTGGKSTGKTGIFEVANGGTIFLDEIGEMPPHVQVKLLRVLQEKKIRRLGGNKEIDIDVRILSATNRSLVDMVAKNQFRLDLLYRINIFTLNIPALRERKEDIKVLSKHFINKYSTQYGKCISGINPEGMKKLTNYNWPGNVRELQNVIERGVALAEGHEIISNDIVINNIILNSSKIPIKPLKSTVEDAETEAIINALKNNKSIRSAAKSLEVTHTLLINRMKKYNINFEDGGKLYE